MIAVPSNIYSSEYNKSSHKYSPTGSYLLEFQICLWAMNLFHFYFLAGKHLYSDRVPNSPGQEKEVGAVSSNEFLNHQVIICSSLQTCACYGCKKHWPKVSSLEVAKRMLIKNKTQDRTAVVPASLPHKQSQLFPVVSFLGKAATHARSSGHPVGWLLGNPELLSSYLLYLQRRSI